ncbi:restriction endonuclease [Enterobacter ludwigii]|uniref:restriction endonuclease n=1 Tax=Enterobacter ludwigii TaxID=299767 RepID=UPI0010CCF9A6|nr:restriction endonuclease [Enterobacter ludwigii]MDR0165130.1 restriction endonuclease [Enterobacter ludwigii]QCR92212.1 restriction endonuclease [Enterobacter ludwigii]QCU05083.1 restriction endonuclease [Enterobacter ludwigii]
MTRPSMKVFVDLLSKSPISPPPEKWQALESHVQDVYQHLLDIQGNKTMVARNVQISGREGSSYQIDVYYEFEMAGIRHSVAVECKNRSRPLERDSVLAFHNKIHQCCLSHGIIVSSGGFQKGAREFAEQNNVTLMDYSELPSIGNLLSRRLTNVVIPDEDTIGQPFWTIFDIEEYSPFGHIDAKNEFMTAFLFLSRAHAQRFLKGQNLGTKWQVRGMAQRHLTCYILTCDAFNARYVIARPGYAAGVSENQFLFDEIRRKDLINDFHEGVDLPEEPNTAPGYRSIFKKKSGI